MFNFEKKENILQMVLRITLLLVCVLFLYCGSSSQAAFAADTVYTGTGAAKNWEARYDGAGTLTLQVKDYISTEESLSTLFNMPDSVINGTETLIINGTGDSVSIRNRFELPALKHVVLKGHVSSYTHSSDSPAVSLLSQSDLPLYLYCSSSNALETVDIQGTVKSCDFRSSTKLKSVHFADWYSPNDVNNWLYFKDATSLESVVIDHTLENSWYANGDMFCNCSSLKELKINGSLKEISGTVFYGCESLVDFPDMKDVTRIATNAFYFCRSLKSLDFSSPIDVGGIGQYYIFAGCDSLETVHFSHVKSLQGGGLFSRCPNLRSIVIDSMDAPAVFNGCDFYGCTSLKTLRLPKGISRMGPGEFNGCASLTQFPAFDQFASVSTDRDWKAEQALSSDVLGIFNNCTSVTEVEFPEDLDITQLTNYKTTFTSDFSFRNCTSLKRVVLPKLGTFLATNMFQGCTSLTQVILPDGITSLYGTAFTGCDLLQSLVIPASVTSMKTLMQDNAIRTVYFTADLPDYIKNGSKSTVFGTTDPVKCYYPTGNATWAEYVETASSRYPDVVWIPCDEDEIGETPDPPIVDVSDADSTANYIMETKAIPFHYSASNGKRRSFSFRYSDRFFHYNEDGINFNQELALASLSAAMSGYSDIRKISTEKGYTAALAEDDYSRAYNIHELYSNLKFSDPRFYNYNKPLNDSSDKVACSMAHKYINAGDGYEDTVIAVVVRGGCYGAEWASNFNVVNGTDYDSDHYGFSTAVSAVESRVNDYVRELLERGSSGIRGRLKIWITGYSRGSAVANKVAHDLNANGVAGRVIHEGDMYAYTFATPNIASRVYAGKPANISYHYYKKDADIFNIVSPADLVPKAPIYDWGYGRYGRTLYLPTDNYDGLWNQYETLSGKTISHTERISSHQPIRINIIEKLAKQIAPDRVAYRSTLQDLIWLCLHNSNQKPSDNSNNIGAVLDVLKDAATGSTYTSDLVTMEGINALDLLKAEIANVGRAHEPEHYYAHLFMDKLDSIEDFKECVPINRITIRGLDDNKDFALVIYQGGAVVGSIRNGKIQTDQQVVCDDDGAVVSRTQTVNIVEASGNYYIELFDPDCKVEMTSADGQKISVEQEAIGEEFNTESSTSNDNITIRGEDPLVITQDDFVIPEADPEPTPAPAVKVTKPKATTITKLKPGKKKVTVKWKKRSGIKGYQIQYCLKKSFKKGAKTVTIKKAKTTSKVIKKLKKKKTYYFRIRTYKIVKGKKVCSAWSKPKKVKIK